MSRQYTHNGHTRRVIRPDLTDEEVAASVGKLMRGEIDHDGVCCMARDRILCLTQENAKLQDQIKLLQDAIVKSVSWCDRAEHQREQMGPVLRDYLCHARNAALEGLEAVPIKTPASP
jgi:hypothetical protein